MTKKAVIAVLILIAIAVIGLYLYGIFVGNDSPTDNLFRTLAVVFLCAAGIVRNSTAKGRRPLEKYAESYKREIGNAFIANPALRKRLLCAIRFYNEENYRKAIDGLIALQPECNERDDYAAVGLFLALSFTDVGANDAALEIYGQLVEMGIETSTIYGNIGHLHVRLGNTDEAATALIKAAQLDPNNAYPLCNVARLYFDKFEFDKAIKWAERALQINHKIYQASTMLAIIYAIRGEGELEKKYAHMAISSGQNPDKLKQAILHYKVSVELANETNSENQTSEDLQAEDQAQQEEDNQTDDE